MVGRDFRHVQTLHRVLSVALFDTPFRDAFGVPDSNDRRTFATFWAWSIRWCDGNDAILRHELEALDGASRRRRRPQHDGRLARLGNGCRSRNPTSRSIFRRGREYYVVRKATYRGGTGRHLHHVENLTREEALHWLAHDPHGRSLARERGEPISDLADLLVEASMRPTEKREAPKMDMTKTLREVGEAGFTQMIEKYAKTVHPTLTKEQAFTKVFTELTTTKAVRSAARTRSPSKARSMTTRPRTRPRASRTTRSKNWKSLPQQERRRNPTLTKAQAFTKVYTDPANAKLAQRERVQNRPKA